MGYAVEIRRTHLDVGTAIYSWQATYDAAGYVVLDRDSATIRPCDADGRPKGEMRLSRSVGYVENAVPSSVEQFVVVAASIFRSWRDEEPPRTAHRYFG
ncbi:protein of unknown function [Streptantibioticus cattleyicolor NRRL 8057 = DSM 46488]|nr:protein of unknown function [Streptantibioticus cattleyicolor NRRL 8057 = DSM 46488]